MSARCPVCPKADADWAIYALDELRIVLALAAADLNQNRRQADAATSHMMLDAIAVLLRREPGCHPFYDYRRAIGLAEYVAGFRFRSHSRDPLTLPSQSPGRFLTPLPA